VEGEETKALSIINFCALGITHDSVRLQVAHSTALLLQMPQHEYTPSIATPQNVGVAGEADVCDVCCVPSYGVALPRPERDVANGVGTLLSTHHQCHKIVIGRDVVCVTAMVFVLVFRNWASLQGELWVVLCGFDDESGRSYDDVFLVVFSLG